MYGVDCATPPHTPATSVAIASVSRMSRVLKSSPATRALSVTLMPPTTVSSANGAASGRYFSAATNPFTNSSVGTGKPKWSSAAGSGL